MTKRSFGRYDWTTPCPANPVDTGVLDWAVLYHSGILRRNVKLLNLRGRFYDPNQGDFAKPNPAAIESQHEQYLWGVTLESLKVQPIDQGAFALGVAQSLLKGSALLALGVSFPPAGIAILIYGLYQGYNDYLDRINAGQGWAALGGAAADVSGINGIYESATNTDIATGQYLGLNSEQRGAAAGNGIFQLVGWGAAAAQGAALFSGSVESAGSGEFEGLSIAERQAMVADRSPETTSARTDRAAMLRQVRTDLGSNNPDDVFQATVARRYWRELVSYERPVYDSDGNLTTRTDVELMNGLIEVSNHSGGGKLSQILTYQQYAKGRPVALFTREPVPVGRQVDYVGKSGATLIGNSDWELLDAFVYQGVQY